MPSWDHRKKGGRIPKCKTQTKSALIFQTSWTPNRTVSGDFIASLPDAEKNPAWKRGRWGSSNFISRVIIMYKTVAPNWAWAWKNTAAAPTPVCPEIHAYECEELEEHLTSWGLFPLSAGKDEARWWQERFWMNIKQNCWHWMSINSQAVERACSLETFKTKLLSYQTRTV